MSEKIKIQDELKTKFPNHRLDDKFDLELQQFSAHDMVEFAEIIAKQLLELAAENAEIDEFPPVDEDGKVFRHEITINKNSILDTIKQVE